MAMHHYRKLLFFILIIVEFHGLLYSQEEAGYFLLGYNKGNFTYGLRNIQCYLENFNLYYDYDNDSYSKVLKPFAYRNNYQGFSIGFGGMGGDDEKFKVTGEITWTHHRNIYSAEVYERTKYTQNLTPIYENVTYEYKVRINYLSAWIGPALTIVKHLPIYMGIGFDYGKLSFFKRNYISGQAPTKFEKLWHGELFVNPGGRFTSFTTLIGIKPYYKVAALDVRLYYQLQLFPTSAIEGSKTEYYINISSVGIKISMNFGIFETK